MNRKYTTVIFDLDGTLRVSNPRFMDALTRHLADIGYPFAEDQRQVLERWVHYYWARSAELRNDLRVHGESQLWLRFMYRLLHLAGHPVTMEEAQQVVMSFFEVYHPESVLMPDVLDVLDTLHASGVRMGVLSNRHHPFNEELEQLGIAHYFQFAVAAGETGYWKPDPRIFQVALQRVGIDPQQSVYIGDNYYADVLGAQSAGLDAILVNDRRLFHNVDCPKVRSLREIIPLVLSSPGDRSVP